MFTKGRETPPYSLCNRLLYTRSTKKGDIREVLHQLVMFGADPSIMIDAHPHIGSNKLPQIIEQIRKCIISHGGSIHFNTRVTDLIQDGENKFSKRWRVVAQEKEFTAKSVILATGHSAKDIYSLFYEKGWEIEAKGFALGVRAEHPQQLINDIQYHGKYIKSLPAA